jgi:hypothetical protein
MLFPPGSRLTETSKAEDTGLALSKISLDNLETVRSKVSKFGPPHLISAALA